MKAIYFIILLFGIILMLGGVSEYAVSNMVGLAVCVYSCDKLGLFYSKNT